MRSSEEASRGAELLSPAGDFDTALAAFDAGADAVYCGLADFSARAFAKNFTPDELRDLMRVARERSRKVYVTFNTLVEEEELPRAAEALSLLESLEVDGVIVQDIGVARLCARHFPRLSLHASTQLVAHNLEGVLALKELGFRRVVLARELTLEEVSSIAKRCGVEIECFIHGALCYSLSGLCLFSAMEKSRSGNRGRCAYCCRLPFDGAYPFSMKDLRLGEDARLLAQAGVASLKIEGRMKSALYVASVVKRYREILDGAPQTLTDADLETVFSRRTTPLYLHGERDDVIEPEALGHLGTPIGEVKRVTKDREGRRWIRFHASRALERHDGLQFLSPGGGKPIGFGIGEMRKALSRSVVFKAAAGDDVEVLLPDSVPPGALTGGETVYLSMSNEVKRRFPPPSYRPGDYPGIKPLAVELRLEPGAVEARAHDARGLGGTVCTRRELPLASAREREASKAAAERAFSRLGGTDWHLESLALEDSHGLFAPASVLNDLRRELVRLLDDAAERERLERLDAIDFTVPPPPHAAAGPARRSLRLASADDAVPPDDRDETIVCIGDTVPDNPDTRLRYALPVFTHERDYPRLRTAVKRLIRLGCRRFEVADLAGLRLVASLGVDDVSADWTLYAANTQALAALAERGVSRFVASPESSGRNIAALAASGWNVEFLEEQSTPLFISLHRPAIEPEAPPARDGADTGILRAGELVCFRRGPLWITTRLQPRYFDLPNGVSSRRDLSWTPPPTLPPSHPLSIEKRR